jgi:hypothetical protein
MDICKSFTKPFICLMVITGGLLLMTGCIPMPPLYQEDFTTLTKPLIPLQQAQESLKQELQAAYFNNASPLEDVQVTDQAFSFKAQGNTYTVQIADIKSLSLIADQAGMLTGTCDSYYAFNGFKIYWKQSAFKTARDFPDAIAAIKYYTSTH